MLQQQGRVYCTCLGSVSNVAQKCCLCSRSRDEFILKIVLWGGGGHGAVVLDAARRQRVHEVVAIFDDGPKGKSASFRFGLPVLCSRQQLLGLRREGVEGIIIAIGDEAIRRERALNAISLEFKLCTIVHPSAVVCEDVLLGS